MKKLLGIVVLGLLLSVNSFAEIELLERQFIKSPGSGIYVSKVCVDEYEYVVINTRTVDKDQNSQLTNAITQSFEIVEGKSLPKKCK